MVQIIEDQSLQNISNRINFRKSQTSILYVKFSVFYFNGKQCMKTPVNVFMKVQRIAGVLPRMSIQLYFCGVRPSLFFFDRVSQRHVCKNRACTQKMSYFHVFPEKSRRFSFFAQGKNIMFSEKKNTIIPDNIKIMCRRSLFGKTIFSESLKKIYFRVFF